MSLGITAVITLYSLCLASIPFESFESETASAISASGGCTITRVQEHTTDGAWALQLTFPGKPEDTWPGINLKLPQTQFTRNDILVFDAFNPGPDPLPLSFRIDSADKRSTFTGQTVPPGKATKVELWIGSLSSAIDINNIASIYPYVRCPRQDWMLFADAFRFESVKDRFSRLAYHEMAQPPSPQDDENALGCLLFTRNPLAHVFENSVPWPGESPAAITLFAAQGETETCALSFRTLRPLEDASIDIAPLTSATGALPPNAIETARVRFLDKRTTYPAKDFITGVPTYAEPGASFGALPENTTRTFWIRIRIPRDAQPGQYQGNLTIRTRENGAEHTAQRPITLRILPFSLSGITTHFAGEYYRMRPNVKPEQEAEVIDRDFADMRDHGMTSVGLCHGLDTETVTLNGTEVASLGFNGTSRFERFMDAYVRHGYPMPLVLLSDSGQSVAAKAGPFGSPEYNAAYQSFWRKVQQTAKEKGWPEIIVQPIDEPSWQGEEEKTRNVHLLSLLKQIPGLRTEQDGPADAYFRTQAGPLADLWNYNGAIDPFEQVAAIRQQHLVAIYNNDVESYRPEVDRYVSGFFQKAAGIDGVFNWEYCGGGGDIYDDQDGENGDFGHYYPANDTTQGGPSLAWEAAREGIDDLRYLITLEQAIATARNQAEPNTKSLAETAASDLNRLLVSLQAKSAVRGSDQWTARWTKAELEQSGITPASDAPAYIGGFLKHPIAWSHRDFARARWFIASRIMHLLLLYRTANVESAAPAISIAGCTAWSQANADKTMFGITSADVLAYPHDFVNIDLTFGPVSPSPENLRIRLIRDGQPLAQCEMPIPQQTNARVCLQFEGIPTGIVGLEITRGAGEPILRNIEIIPAP